MENQRCFDLLQSGDADALRRLLEQDPATSEARDSGGVSLVMQCVYRGRRDLAEITADRKKALDIHEAAALGRLDRLRELARDPDTLNSRSMDGFTALHFACFFGTYEAARVLIEAGASVDAAAANPTQVMPLHSAASVRNLEAVRLLLLHGAPPNARQQAGWAPIHAAAQNGDTAMVELLIQHGADPLQPNDEGKTPAMIARAKGHDALASILEK